MKNKIKSLIPYVVLLTSFIAIIAVKTYIAFLFIGIAVLVVGILLGKYTKLSYKPYIALLFLALIVFIITIVLFNTQEQPKCSSFAVLCISQEFILTLVVSLFSVLVTGYTLGILIPAVAIGKKLKLKKN